MVTLQKLDENKGIPILLYRGGELMTACCCDCANCCCDSAKEMYDQDSITITIDEIADAADAPDALSCIKGSWCLPFKETETSPETKCVWYNKFWLGTSRKSTFSITVKIAEVLSEKGTATNQGCAEVIVGVQTVDCEDCVEDIFIASPPTIIPLHSSAATDMSCDASYPETSYTDINTSPCDCTQGCWSEHNYSGSVSTFDPQIPSPPSDGNNWTTIASNLSCLARTCNFDKSTTECFYDNPSNAEFTNAHHPEDPGNPGEYFGCDIQVNLESTFADCCDTVLNALTPAYKIVTTASDLFPTCEVGEETRETVATFQLSDDTGPTYAITIGSRWTPDRYDSCEYEAHVTLPDVPCPDENVDPCDPNECGTSLTASEIHRGTEPTWYTNCKTADWATTEVDVISCAAEPDHEVCLCGCVTVDVQLKDLDGVADDAPIGGRLIVQHTLNGVTYNIPYTRAMFTNEGVGADCHVWQPDTQPPLIVICSTDVICTETKINAILDDMDHQQVVTCDDHGAAPAVTTWVEYHVHLDNRRDMDAVGGEVPGDQDCENFTIYYQATPCTYAGIDSELTGDCIGTGDLYIACQSLPSDIMDGDVYKLNDECYVIDTETEHYDPPTKDSPTIVGPLDSCDDCCCCTIYTCDFPMTAVVSDFHMYKMDCTFAKNDPNENCANGELDVVDYIVLVENTGDLVREPGNCGLFVGPGQWWGFRVGTLGGEIIPKDAACIEHWPNLAGDDAGDEEYTGDCDADIATAKAYAVSRGCHFTGDIALQWYNNGQSGPSPTERSGWALRVGGDSVPLDPDRSIYYVSSNTADPDTSGVLTQDDCDGADGTETSKCTWTGPGPEPYYRGTHYVDTNLVISDRSVCDPPEAPP